MKRITRRLSIMQVTFALTLIMSVFTLILLVQNLYLKSVDSTNAKTDIQLANIIQTLESVAHHHAVERGLTAGYLNNPTSENYQRVIAQRKSSDRALNTYRQLAADDNEAVNENTGKLQLLLTQSKMMTSIRQKVDNLDGVEAFGFYSQFNRMALDLAKSLTLSVNHKTIVPYLSDAIMIADFKEILGQRRGKINGILARGLISNADRMLLSQYAGMLELTGQYLLTSLPAADLAKLNDIRQSSENMGIGETVNALMQPTNIQFERLPVANQWFSDATKEIVRYRQLLDDRWITVEARGIEIEQQMVNQFIGTLLFSLFVLGFVLWINVSLTKNLRLEMSSLQSALHRLEGGDFTVDVRLDSANELGTISGAVHNMTNAFKDVLHDLNHSVRSGVNLSSNMSQATEALLSDSNKTQQMAANITTAIEEMSYTSNEIARSASHTLQASENLTNNADSLVSHNRVGKQSLQKLTDDLSSVEGLASQMEVQMESMTTILDAMSKIAEQTNLLALNAAIEAARAGEYGRGFAVVADEVRGLASDSRNSAEQIANLLLDLQTVSQQVVNAVRINADLSRSTSSEFEKVATISEQVYQFSQEVGSLATTVATAAEEQSTVSGSIAEDTKSVLDCANSGVETSRQLEEIFANIKSNADSLQQTMKSYRFQ